MDFPRNGNLSHHSFKEFLNQDNINHIIARVKHPQTNGKIERWFGLLEKKLKLFNFVDEFVLWFNILKPHTSLNLDVCETPEQAFWRKLPAGNEFSIILRCGSGQLCEMNSGYQTVKIKAQNLVMMRQP